MSSFYIAGHALIKNNEGKYLILKRAVCNDYMPLIWDIPGGTVEMGETVEETIKREIQEECALDVIPISPMYVYSNLSQIPNRHTVQIVYYCNYVSGEIKLNPREHGDYKWVSKEELANYDKIAFLNDLYINAYDKL